MTDFEKGNQTNKYDYIYPQAAYNQNSNEYQNHQYDTQYTNSYEQPGYYIGDQLTPLIDQNKRLKFIQKVYLILSIMLIWTSSIVMLCFLSNPVYSFIINNIWIFYTALALYFILFIVLVCFSRVARKKPWNYIFVFLFATAVGIVLGTSIPGNYDGTYVLICLAITLFITFSVSIYACQTKKDFTTKGGLLFSLFVSLLVLIILQFFMRDRIIGLLISVFGAFLMTIYIIYDTQIIVGGKHRQYQLGSEEHVFATLMLYTDILNLFLFILGIGRK